MPVPAGALRFNSDSGKLEYYNGEVWWQIDNFSADNATGGARGVFGGGQSPVHVNVIQYVTISTTGNTQDFGDLSVPNMQMSGCSSSTRGIFAGGTLAPGARTNTIEFVTISITSNVTDFGDLTFARDYFAACSSSTRGLFGGGFSPSPTNTRFNVIDYITIAATGNAVDFGDLSSLRQEHYSCSSSTRGIFAGGYSPSPLSAYLNTIEFVTISTLGNTSDFGDLTTIRGSGSSCSNSTRGIFAGGYSPNAPRIDFITIASNGNSTSFGDLSVARNNLTGCSSPTRGVFSGGNTPTATNTIDYITILSTGNAIDFGDLLTAQARMGGFSNAHGGL
jgi:hypothetical protein